MTLKLRRGTVVTEDPLTVDVEGERRPAWADPGTVGEVREGDEVVVNTEAVDLGLGSGGFDVVHVNLTRGLEAPGAEAVHVMKLNYTSLQHPVEPVEPELDGDDAPARAIPVLVFHLHGQLPPILWAAAREGFRVGYVQTPGGALPGALSRDVAELRRARAARGPRHRRARARRRARGDQRRGRHRRRGASPRLGRVRRRAGARDTRLGQPPRPRRVRGPRHPAHRAGARHADPAGAAAVELGPTGSPPRAEPPQPHRAGDGARAGSRPGSRDRDRGLAAAGRRGARGRLPTGGPGGPDRSDEGQARPRGRSASTSDGYAASGLPARTMGRDLDEDPLFFAAALAAGAPWRARP